MGLVKMNKLKPQQNNANRHTQRGIGMLESSIQRDGWIGAITVAADGETFDGSARLEVGALTGFEDAIVVESDGSRPIVHIRTDIPHADDPRAKRLGVAANRIASVDLEWDTDVLAGLKDEGLLDDLFFSDELDALLASAEPVVGNGGDEFDTTPQEGPTRVQPGDVWRIGEHRLMCGDSTNPQHVERLMGGERAQAVVTDPPYGINREGVTNDDPEGLRELYTGIIDALPVDNAVIAAFQSTRLFTEWLDATRAAGHRFERMLWMYKPNDITFPWRGWILKSEAILVSTVGKAAWVEMHPYAHDCYTANWDRDNKVDIDGWHGSIKPLTVIVDLVPRVTPKGGIAYDPCLGSGTTLIAANRTGRKCYGMELEPKYCDVILRRAEAEGITPIERIQGNG